MREEDPLRRLQQNVIEANRRLASRTGAERIGRNAVGAATRAARRFRRAPARVQEERRSGISDVAVNNALKTLHSYENGRLMVVGAWPVINPETDRYCAKEVASALAEKGTLKGVRALGFCAVGLDLSGAPPDMNSQRGRLISITEEVQRQVALRVDNSDRLDILIRDPVIVSDRRPGDIDQQAYSGLSRAIGQLRNRLPSNDDELTSGLAMVVVTDPSKSDTLLNIPPDKVKIAGVAALEKVVSEDTPAKNEWQAYRSYAPFSSNLY